MAPETTKYNQMLTVHGPELSWIQLPVSPGVTVVVIVIVFFGFPLLVVEHWLSSKGVQDSQQTSG